MLKEQKTPPEKSILLTVGLVVRCEPEKAEGLIEQIGKSAKIIYLKQSYGKLWIKEEQQGDSYGEEKNNRGNL